MKIKRLLVMLCAFVILLSAVPALASEQVAPGVRQWSFTKTNWEGKPYQGYVLEVDPKQRFTEIRPIMANDVIGNKETLSSMAQRTGAVAAINGGYFDIVSGMPVGNVFVDGQALHISDILRTSFGFTGTGEVKLGYLAPKMKLEVEGYGQINLRGINMPASNDGVILYSAAWNKAVITGVKFKLTPEKDQLYRLDYTYDGEQAPPGGYIVAGFGSSASQLMSIPAGSGVRVVTEKAPEWQDLKHGLTGSPLLVENGLPVEQAVNEGLWGKVLKPAPRTALGVNAKGRVLLVVVDGRQDHSAGLTLEELAYLMVELGCVRAVALDGGGSTEMWVKGQIVNSLSEKSERPLANGLVVIQQMPVYIDYARLYFDVPPLLENGRTLVPMRKIFEQLGAEITWDAETKTVTALREGRVIELKAGNNNALVDGTPFKLDVPAKIVDGRTLVPLRFVGESLGAKVNYVTSGGPAIYIESPKGGIRP